MRTWSLISFAIVGAACTVRLPKPGEVGINVKVTTRVEARAPAPPQAQVIVPIENAPVVEFFGIPLEGAEDVVFVLDVSGSMDDPAQGRLAQIHVDSAPPPANMTPGTPPPSVETPPPPANPPGPPPPPPPPPAAPTPTDQTAATAPPADATAPAEAAAPAGPPPPRKIDVAKAELVAALVRLPAGTRMNVVFFNTGLEGFAPTLVPLDEQGRATLLSFVRETDADGSTALAPAMRTAFLMNARRIVLLSDGLGNVGGNSESVLHDAREAIRGGVRIDTIGLGTDQDRALLATLAQESGGLYQPL